LLLRLLLRLRLLFQTLTTSLRSRFLDRLLLLLRLLLRLRLLFQTLTTGLRSRFLDRLVSQLELKLANSHKLAALIGESPLPL